MEKAWNFCAQYVKKFHVGVFEFNIVWNEQIQQVKKELED